jgi:predicted ester cyclase
MPAPSKGNAEVKKYFNIFAKAFSDTKLQTLNAWGVGDFVIEEGTYSGKHTGVLMGAPPSKKEFTIHELNVVQFNKDRKIVKGVTYGNDSELMDQLSPPKPPPAPAKPK